MSKGYDIMKNEVLVLKRAQMVKDAKEASPTAKDTEDMDFKY